MWRKRSKAIKSQSKFLVFDSVDRFFISRTLSTVVRSCHAHTRFIKSVLLLWGRMACEYAWNIVIFISGNKLKYGRTSHCSAEVLLVFNSELDVSPWTCSISSMHVVMEFFFKSKAILFHRQTLKDFLCYVTQILLWPSHTSFSRVHLNYFLLICSGSCPICRHSLFSQTGMNE